MRLGNRPSIFKKDVDSIASNPFLPLSLIFFFTFDRFLINKLIVEKLYNNQSTIYERHRHRYEVFFFFLWGKGKGIK